MVSKETVERINQLAAKNKAEGLTEDEVAEREVLRREYLKSIRNNVKGHLSKIKFVEDLSQEEIDELANKNNKQMNKLKFNSIIVLKEYFKV